MIKVKQSGDNLEVLTHGMELYLYLDENNTYNDSGGEFKIILFPRRQYDQWSVYQTQDVSRP